MKKTNIISWILFIPGAFLTSAGIVIAFSYLLLLLGIKNQLVFDGVSAFLGNLIFLLTINLYVPQKKELITKIIIILLVTLAILEAVLSILGVYNFVGMKSPSLILPILQIAGILLASLVVKSLS